MLHVAHLTSVHPRTDVRILGRECGTLARNGYRVTLVVADGLGSERTREDVVVSDIGRTEGSRFERMTMSVFRMLIAARELRADLYHLHDPELLPAGVALSRSGSAVIYDAHEDVPRNVLTKHWIPPILRSPVGRMVEVIENACVKRLTAVVGATPTITRRFEAIAPQIATVRNFPLLEEFDDESEFDSRAEEACYIGGVTLSRGLAQIVRACGIANVRLSLAGAREKETMGELEKTPGWDLVSDLGELSRQGIRALLSRTRIGIVTLLPEPNVVEALPVKLFEYMAAGLPVVASNFPIWREIVEGSDCGLCVDPSNPGAVAGAIRRILDDPVRASEMSANGRIAAREIYNWREEEPTLLALYDRVLSGRRTRRR